MTWYKSITNCDICRRSVIDIHNELKLRRRLKDTNFLSPAVNNLKVQLEVAVRVNLVVVALWEGSYPKSFPVERSISLKVNLKP